MSFLPTLIFYQILELYATKIDYDNDTITYWYDDHKTNKRITVTEHVFYLKLYDIFLISIIRLLDITEYTRRRTTSILHIMINYIN